MLLRTSALRQGPMRGSALLLCFVVISLVAITVTGVLSQGTVAVKYAAHDVERRKLRLAAEAGIQRFRALAGASAYDGTGNVWLRANNKGSLPAGDVNLSQLDDFASFNANGSPNIVAPTVQPNVTFDILEPPVNAGGATTPRVRVNIHVYLVAATTFRGIATATHLKTGQTASLAINVNERDLFSKYLFFFNNASISIGSTTVRGDVHDNQSIIFGSPDAKMYGSTTAVTGFSGAYYAPSSVVANEVQFFGFTNGAAQAIPLPPIAAIPTLKNFVAANETQFQIMGTPAAADYWGSTQGGITGFKTITSSGLVFNHDVASNQSRVTITATGIMAGTTSTAHTRSATFPLPAGGVIYSDKAYTALEGTISGRVTVVTDSTVSITNTLQYVDQDGDSMFRLTNNGTPVTNLQSTGTTAWLESNGYLYTANPNFNPAGLPATLGLIANSTISVAAAAPYNMVVNAAMVSVTGGGTLLPSGVGVKGNWRFLGSMTTDDGFSRYSGSVNTGTGYSKSGEYIYDTNLKNFPPPHYLGVEIPVFGTSYEVRNNSTGTIVN